MIIELTALRQADRTLSAVVIDMETGAPRPWSEVLYGLDRMVKEGSEAERWLANHYDMNDYLSLVRYHKGKEPA